MKKLVAIIVLALSLVGGGQASADSCFDGVTWEWEQTVELPDGVTWE